MFTQKKMELKFPVIFLSKIFTITKWVSRICRAIILKGKDLAEQ